MKKILLLALLACTLHSCSTSSNTSSENTSRSALGHRPGPKGFRTVIIDAGHGGKDSGAVSSHTSQMEKNAALDTAKRIKSSLSSHHTVLMRSGDEFIDLDERVARANQHNDAILISMHYNSGPSHIRGPETYYWRVDSHGLATRLQSAMASVSPAENSNRGLVRRRLRLTRNPEIPCVLLEGGYMSNPAESKLVNDPAYRQRLADAIAGAIKAQSALGDAGTGPLPPPLNAPLSRPTDAAE